MKRMPNFYDFMKEVKEICEKSAKEKGYNETGVNGQNDLYQFIRNTSNTDSHAIGEIIYKAVRYSKKKDRKDLIKIAAWAFLIYRYGTSEQTSQR